MSTHTVTMSKSEIYALKARLTQAQLRKTPPYAIYQLKLSDCMITAYESGKVVFQGDGADHYAPTASAQKKKKEASSTSHVAHVQDHYPQAGSDEVGTGDYFGPITVAAAYVTQEQVTYLRELGIQDSKAVNDIRIRELGPILMDMLPHSLLILDNDTYNRIHSQYNMVAIKSRLHNQAYVHLRKKLQGLPSFCVIDQFVQGSSYYRYLQEETEVVRGIHFETKAENKYLSVACGSIIARYAFLKAFDSMCDAYDFTFLKGAGAKVDINIRQFVEKHGKEPLLHVAKLHFANTEKALNR